MPKMKTSRSARKRFIRTGTGKIMHYTTGHRHLLEKKRTRRKRAHLKKQVVFPGDLSRVKALLPYMK
jgi:large subunit ribosomal protein L35